ncbi:hypothetical protein N7603_04120 [Acholeplasma vituli]|uniref:Uncharacterized protein n=1 Tax=Paracholeplasma vituli TaxID=69473 RepID=A0ABT2PYL0_9MOLU|nr:hypothetical protein [Paracholeplasma vituli]MCU0104837.1 hypothetical protein [Paracholeplasma vituli]
MFKRIGITLFVSALMILTGCKPKIELTTITLNGVSDVLSIPYGSYFNVLDGITANGDDLKDYTAYLTFETEANVSETGILDTTISGQQMILYRVRFGEFDVSKWRYLYVLQP